MARGAKHSVRRHAAPLARDDGSPLRVLVVEDEAVVALSLERTLEGLGAETVADVRNAYAAIAPAERERPDVVLMDISLDGDLDGIEAARIIRDRLGIPSVLITGHNNPVIELRVAELGNAELLSKPALGATLDGALRRACLRHS
jgi:CheY-like chemotaxis protein